MQHVSLPAELLDAIVDYIPDTASCRTCMTVSQAFYQSASRRLYRSFHITIWDEARITERQCKKLNTLLAMNPHVISSVRSLALEFSIDKWCWHHVEGEDGDEGATIANKEVDEFWELTKFLLRMTHAPCLEQLSISSVYRELGSTLTWGQRLHTVRESVLLGLMAIRCMPSLRRASFACLDRPPTALVIGIPGQDSLESMTVDYGTFDINEPDTYWKWLDIPRKGQLAMPFREAKADWDAILRVNSDLVSFTDLALRQLTELRLKRLGDFYSYLQHVQSRIGRPMAPGPLFPSLTTFRYLASEVEPFVLEDLPFHHPYLDQVARMLVAHCPCLYKLVLEIDPDNTMETFPLATLPKVRELEFVLTKQYFFNRESMNWVTTVVQCISTLRKDHQLDAVTISWQITNPGDERLYTSERWRELEDLMDEHPSLANANMVINSAIQSDRVSLELVFEYSRNMPLVWNHPRCISNYVFFESWQP